MHDKSCYFEPTDTLNGIPTLSYRCQASSLWALRSGRQKYGCGYPPSVARSQNTRSGILGEYTKDGKAVVMCGCFCKYGGMSRMSIKIGILGYGNLGRGVECAVKQNPDMELVAGLDRKSVV